MYFTTILRLCNSGIWQDKRHLNRDYTYQKFPPTSTFIEYDNIGSVGDDIRNNNTLKALLLYGGIWPNIQKQEQGISNCFVMGLMETYPLRKLYSLGSIQVVWNFVDSWLPYLSETATSCKR